MGDRQIPASLRYLRTRVQVLAKPSVLGSLAVLILALVFLAEYWNQPLQFTGQPGAVADPGGSNPIAEGGDRPLPSPTGLLEALMEPINDPTQRPEIPGDALADPASKTDTTDPLQRLLQASQSTDGDSSLSSSLSSNALNAVFATGARRSSVPLSSSAARASGGMSSAAIAPLAPWNAALPQRPISPQASGAESVASEPAAVEAEAVAGSTGSAIDQRLAPGQPIPETTLPLQRYLPQTSPPPGTTGYTLPAAFQIPPGPSYSSGYGSSGYGSSGYGSSGYGVSYPNAIPQPVPGIQVPSIAPVRGLSSQPLPGYGANSYSGPTYPSNPYGGSGAGTNGNTNNGAYNGAPNAPFSVPNTGGRAIGGGEINTFSNP